LAGDVDEAGAGAGDGAVAGTARSDDELLLQS
jgi:hypothetical protein